jgi:hypothetical protein
MTYGQVPKPDQRIYCTVAGCEFNHNTEWYTLEGIRVENNEHGERDTCEQSMCGSFRPR